MKASQETQYIIRLHSKKDEKFNIVQVSPIKRGVGTWAHDNNSKAICKSS